MAYKIITAERAEQDLDNIPGYMVRSLAIPSAAASFANAAEACYSDLERTPLADKVDEAAKTVHILRFFFSRQDYEKRI